MTPPATPSPLPKGPDALTFEQAMEQLESIVERVEGGEIGLEQALAEYERGVALVRRCREVLQRAELRVEELSKLAADADRAGGVGGGGGGGGGSGGEESAPF